MPVLFALRAKVDEEVDWLVKEYVMRPVEQSVWAAPVVVLRKGDDSIRLYRRLQSYHQNIPEEQSICYPHYKRSLCNSGRRKEVY